ncbi:site-specific recombinase XerD [Mobilisporobacter senegalensis]|uniref:Site-specific recombinase XerD n=1 Tax=Mobilisporobacter senegalensis TaxID=1329262 RepID=A0A3N1XRF8_9FIRM|nr:tyrosine-type recombinase/integrase [Mobilisporobacter senegalensis]ROR29215.1 site-specific recombinase XerD [Mobilisporobacter senegalensis]
MKEHNYHDQVNKDNELKLRDIINTLPHFCAAYFRGIEPTTSSRTRLGYAYDISVFFNFLYNQNPYFKGKNIRELKPEVLEQLKPVDIEEYLDYIKYYKKNEKEYVNEESARKRKLISLRSLYNYCYKKEWIDTNPTSRVDIPKLHQKEIIRLDVDEVAMLLDEVESGEALTKSQQKYHNKTKLRDLAIMTLLLGTGIRVSECVGLDIFDVDFKNNGIKIRRKGGNEVVIYFGDEVCEALLDYLDERNHIIPMEGHTNALFLSMQKRRISVKSVENLVKKYSKTVTTLKKITPHKLRSTYGTNLYRETGDIYLVADVLGHQDVNTTKKHYAAIDDSSRRRAAKIVKLREK